VIPLQLGSAIWIGIALYGIGYGLLASALVIEAPAVPSPAMATA
jgi:hypothetical protein